MTFESFIRGVMSGARRGPAAAALRAATAAVEPIYTLAVAARNRRYDRDPSIARELGRPVISVGNLTTGGTGKTPIVRWLADCLRDDGRRVAILSRGYKSAPGTLGDEQRMLQRLLEKPGRPSVMVRANPDRVAAAQAALSDDAAIDLFLLDDAFQHRRVARDLDIVLVNATEPFGFGHVLPRGLLREPLSGLKRAGAVVLTHALSVESPARAQIEREVSRHHPGVPTYQAFHSPIGFRTTAVASGAPPDQPLTAIDGRMIFGLCGIGDPEGFARTLKGLPASYLGQRVFPDHHSYRENDLDEALAAARKAGADVVVTTEKDWVKLAELPRAGDAERGPPLWRLDVVAEFIADDGKRLLEQVRRTVSKWHR